MEHKELRRKISALLAASANHEFVELLFANVPPELLENLLTDRKTE